MSTHSTTKRLDAALTYCDAIEKERRRRQAIREQKQQEKQFAQGQQRHGRLRPKGDYVYVIKASNGYYKIGISVRPHKRFKELQREAATWAISLELVHIIASNKAYVLEQYFHKHFAGQRVIGEWFLLTDCDVKWLQTH